MDNNTELFHQGFSVILFCIAISILFVGYRSYLSALNTAKNMQNDDIIYEQFYDRQNNIVTKGEVIAILFYPLDYDIEIDGLLISRNENTKENIKIYVINHAEYLKSYAYDRNGNITRVIFNGL